MYDQTAVYRTTQVTASSPVGQVALLVDGAIRFATIHLAALERHDLEAAHGASIRSQTIVSALQEVLDMSAGPIATQLDSLYTFILGRLAAGNIAKAPDPTVEAIGLLRELSEAWRTIGGAATVAPAPGAHPTSMAPAVERTPAFSGAAA